METVNKSLCFAAACLLLITPAGCAVEQPATGGVHSCSPNYINENRLGRLAVQQRAAGSSVAWGVYPKLKASKYVVAVYVGTRKVDGKNQSYSPHGSIPGRKAPSGQIFKVVGKSYNPKGKIVQSFFIKCRLA